MEMLKEYFIAKMVDDIANDSSFAENIQKRYPMVSEITICDIIVESANRAVRNALNTLEEFELQEKRTNE